MAKTKNRKRLMPVKGQTKVTDQNTGPQQLYEDRKLGHPDLKDAITADLKRVRKRVDKKLNSRLLNRRKTTSKTESK